MSMRGFAAAALLSIALLSPGCGDDEATSNGADASGAVECPDGGLRFGLEPYDDPAKLRPAYETFMDALSEQLGCPVELVIADDYRAEVEAMRKGELEVAEFGPLGFVFASARAGAEPLASFADGGELSTYTGGIWVPRDSEIENLDDLAGRSLGLSEPASTSGDALPRYALIHEAGLDPERDVELRYAGGHPEALAELTSGKVDAAEINSQQLAASEQEGDFDPADYRRIWESEPIPNDPITVARGLDPALREAVGTALLGIDGESLAEVGAFLDIERPTGMVEVEVEVYEPLFDLADELGLTIKDA